MFIIIIIISSSSIAVVVHIIIFVVVVYVIFIIIIHEYENMMSTDVLSGLFSQTNLFKWLIKNTSIICLQNKNIQYLYKKILICYFSMTEILFYF